MYVHCTIIVHSGNSCSFNHRLHRYKEVKCPQLIWLSQKWQILKYIYYVGLS